jgi:hypothetical protein
VKYYLPSRRVRMAVMKFRPRFTVRTLAIFVTLVCLYFAEWKSAERRAHSSVLRYAQDRGRVPCGTYTVLPYVVKSAEFDEPQLNQTWNYYVYLPHLKPLKLLYEWDAQPGYPYHYTPLPTAPSMWMNDP